MRYALISDIHANLHALDAVLADIDRRRNVDAIYHLGGIPTSTRGGMFHLSLTDLTYHYVVRPTAGKKWPWRLPTSRPHGNLARRRTYPQAL